MSDTKRVEKVLIVDDDHAVVDSVWQYLDLVGFIPIKTYSGAECLEKIASERPDVLLLDLMMPEMDGFEVLEKIKEMNLLERLPVIIVTAKTTEQEQLKGWKQGAAHYITKPFNMDELVSAIHQAIEERKRQINQKIYEV